MRFRHFDLYKKKSEATPGNCIGEPAREEKIQAVMQSSAPPSGQRDGIRNKIRNKIDEAQNKIKGAAFFFVAPLELLATKRVLGTTAYDQVTEEETVAAYVYKMDRPWLQSGELRVEIRQGHALWVIGRWDETVKVKLRRNNKMKLSRATASMSADGVLTVVIPKRHAASEVVPVQGLGA